MGELLSLCICHLWERNTQLSQFLRSYINIILDDHIIDIVQESVNRHRESVGTVFCIQSDIITLLRFKVLVTEGNHHLTVIYREVVVIQLIKSRSTETHGVVGTQVEVTHRIHQRKLWSKSVTESFMIVVTQSGSSLQTSYNSLFVLNISGQGIYVFIDFARSGSKEVVTPVGTNHGGTILHEMEHTLQVRLIRALLLLLNIVANGIALGSHIIFLSITELIGGKGKLDRILVVDLIDTS